MNLQKQKESEEAQQHRNGRNLADALNDEIERCLELVQVYDSLGAVGQFGKAAIQSEIDKAKKARSERDVVDMIYCLDKLRECN